MSTNSVVVVQTPYTRITDGAGTHRLAVDAQLSSFTTVDGVNSNVDAFGRLRVSNPASVFDAKQIYDNNPLLFSELEEGSGTVTYDSQTASSKLAITPAGGRALRQTKRYLNYQPGKSQLIFVTFNMRGLPPPDVHKRAGYYDNSNGLFLQLDSVGPSLVRRSDTTGSVVNDVVTQTSWNIDPLDGTGPSGVTIDFTKVQIMVIDFEWLGVGSVRIGFDIGQSIVYAHRFEQANLGTSVYMRTPNLPVRWEVQAVGGFANNAEMDAICCSVQSEGGSNPLAVQRTASRGTSGASASTTPSSVFSIRLKNAYNRATVFPLNGSVVTTDTGVDYFGQLILNPTLGSALAWNSVTNSPVEWSGTETTVSGGTVIGEFYGISGAPGKSGSATITTTSDLNSVLALASDYAGTSDILTLAVRTLSGTSSSSMFAFMDWLELM